jgi:hypothetical protein
MMSSVDKLIFARTSIGWSPTWCAHEGSIAAIERLKKCCSHLGRGFLGFGEASAKEQVHSNPVTEPKRSQNPKRPPGPLIFPNGYSNFENALRRLKRILQFKGFAGGVPPNTERTTVKPWVGSAS